MCNDKDTSTANVENDNSSNYGFKKRKNLVAEFNDALQYS
jgi:hypothetical protein